MTCSLKGTRCLDVTKSSTDDVSQPVTRPWKMMGTSIDDQCTVLAKMINIKVTHSRDFQTYYPIVLELEEQYKSNILCTDGYDV